MPRVTSISPTPTAEARFVIFSLGGPFSRLGAYVNIKSVQKGRYVDVTQKARTNRLVSAPTAAFYFILFRKVFFVAFG